MKSLKIILICFAGLAIIWGTFKVSKNIIENMNSAYIPQNQLSTAKKQTNEDEAYPKDIENDFS